jgi:catechol 2,3-dioxygenase-like lactoylglutathione lyase family enzyme
MKANAIGVHIKTKDFDASKRFYEALGFEQVFAYGPDQEVKEDYQGMVFQVGQTKLEIADGHRAVKPEVFKRPMPDSKVSLMINVSSLVPVIEICQEKGVPIAVGPRHYYWGTLELVIKDPDGVVLVFIAPYSKREALKIGADEKWGIFAR